MPEYDPYGLPIDSKKDQESEVQTSLIRKLIQIVKNWIRQD